MPSTYSTNLKIELMATGENSGTWGTVTNTNLGTALEQAIVGYGNPDFVTDANLTITLSDSNSLQAARALVLNVTSTASLTVTRELIVPTIQKQYIVQNNTSGSQSITVKTSAGTGVTIPNGKKMHVYVNGTDVVQMDDFALIFNVDNLTLDGNTLSSTNTNGNIVLAPNGTGDVQLDADTVRVGDSNVNVTITSNGTADLILNTNAGTNSGSITIEDGVNGNIIIAPNGTGQVQISNAALDLTTIEVTNIKAKDGTASMTLADSTGIITLSATAGTANGVAYLNGSRALTTGSALTFDGTNLETTGRLILRTGTSPSFAGQIGYTASGGTYIWAKAGSADNFSLYDGLGNSAYQINSSYLHIWSVSTVEQMRLTSTGLKASIAGTNADPVFSYTSDTNTGIFFPAADKLGFTAGGGSDQMVLTSTGLGIGTSSPSRRLDVRETENTAASSTSFWNIAYGGVVVNNLSNTANTVSGIGFYGGSAATSISGIGNILESTSLGALGFFTGGSGRSNTVPERMRLDSSGNLGLGVTPSAWSGTALQVLDLSALSATPAGNTSSALTHAAFWDGTNWRYTTTNVGATRYQMTGANAGSTHSWSVAAGGTANSASVADTKSYTVVALGTTTLLQWQALFSGLGSLPSLGQVITATATGSIPNGGLVTQNISFTQAMTLDASGNLGIGTSSPLYRLSAQAASANTSVANFSGANPNRGLTISTYQSVGGDDCGVEFNAAMNASGYGAFRFVAASTTFATIDASGNLGIGVTSIGAIGSSKLVEIGATTGNSAFLLFNINNARTGAMYSNASETSVGSISATPLLLKTGDTEKARISSDGTFRVKGAGTAGSTDAVQFSGSAPASSLTLDASGNLGIGAATNDNRLNIGGISNYRGIGLTTSTASARCTITFVNTNTNTYGSYIQDSSAGDLCFGRVNADYGGHTERARITSGGDFFIGNGETAASPSAGVLSATGGTGTNIAGANLTIRGGASTGSGAGGVIIFSTAAAGASGTTVRSATERARITSGGNLLVYATATEARGVTIYGNGTNGLYVKTTDTTNYWITNDGAGAGAGFIASIYSDTTPVGSITVTASATAYNTSSDYRLKDNPQPLTGSGAFIDALQPKTWNWKSGGKGVGFIAHEVQEISPDSVVGTKDAVDADGKPIMQAMEYGSAEFIANIIAELQSLRARVAQLEQGA